MNIYLEIYEYYLWNVYKNLYVYYYYIFKININCCLFKSLSKLMKLKFCFLLIFIGECLKCLIEFWDG